VKENDEHALYLSRFFFPDLGKFGLFHWEDCCFVRGFQPSSPVITVDTRDEIAAGQIHDHQSKGREKNSTRPPSCVQFCTLDSQGVLVVSCIVASCCCTDGSCSPENYGSDARRTYLILLGVTVRCVSMWPCPGACGVPEMIAMLDTGTFWRTKYGATFVLRKTASGPMCGDIFK
jgi:hypothetical protein